jgi:hypothetical protein
MYSSRQSLPKKAENTCCFALSKLFTLKPLSIKSFIKTIVPLLFVSISLLSFTTKPGGEGFEVYLNNKLALQRFSNQMNQPQTIQLAQGSPNDELVIKYHHCGQAGKNRVNPMADKGMKTVLDLAAKVAIQHDKELKGYYEKRVAIGKPKMSTINVIRNKLLYRMFAEISRLKKFWPFCNHRIH